MTAIALIEDDAAILRSLQMLLENRGMTVCCFRSAESFLAELQRQPQEQPGCVVSDIRMPGMSGLDLLNEVMKTAPALPVVLITGHGDIAMAVMAIKAGAFDFIEKPFDEERLIASIASAVERGARERIRQNERAELEARVSELSPRQREVMELVAEGLSTKEIAIKLDISPRTVENYRAWVMEKMGANNLAALVRKVVVLQQRDT